MLLDQVLAAPKEQALATGVWLTIKDSLHLEWLASISYQESHALSGGMDGRQASSLKNGNIWHWLLIAFYNKKQRK